MKQIVHSVRQSKSDSSFDRCFLLECEMRREVEIAKPRDNIANRINDIGVELFLFSNIKEPKEQQVYAIMYGSSYYSNERKAYKLKELGRMKYALYFCV